MFSATEPLASSPLATNGTTKLVYGSATLSNAAQTLAGVAEKHKLVYGSAALVSPAQILAGNSLRIRVLNGVGTLSQAAQEIAGNALYTHIHFGSADLEQAPQEILAICYVIKASNADASLLQAAQTISGQGTIVKVKNGAATLTAPPQSINGYVTKIRVLQGSGALTAGAATLYGSEVAPIWIKTLRAPLNVYDAARERTSDPYSTTNHYRTLYQVPGYQEVQSDGTILELSATAIVTAMCATTDELTPQPMSVIVIHVLENGFEVYTIFPAFVTTNGVQNILPMQDFNLVTGDIIQIKALGTGSVTVNMSVLLNTQPYYEVL